MLSIGRLGVASGADYYLASIANSVDDYYLGRGEAPGQWIGATSAALGLSGVVDPVALRNLLGGHGADGEDLGIMRRSDRRPGFDLTFSAPKGLSLLWAFGSPEVRDAVSSAHDRAMAGVVDHLSSEAAYVRRGVDGLDVRKAKGFVAAGFRHRTSRAGDPQLHTHVLIPNVTLGHDGRWSAPDARQLYLWQKAASAMYHSALRADLAPLGLSWNVGRNSLGELSDIPRPILRAFSKRRVDIEASLEEMGLGSQRAAEVATLATRGPKSAHVAAPDVLRQGWAEQLSDIAVSDETGTSRPATLADITGAAGSGASAPMSDSQREEVLAILVGEKPVDLADYDLADPSATRVTPLTLFASTFTHRDALAAVARAIDAPPGEVAELTEQLLRRNEVVRLIDFDLNQPDVSGRGKERPATTVGDRRYSTVEMLRIEGRIVNSAVARLGHGGLPGSLIEPILARHGHLDGEQLAGARRLLGSGNGLDLVIGQAGTGKSTMLGAAREVWSATGYRVIGTAVASRTAADLEAGTGIESVTLARLFIDLERDETRLTSHDVVVVDEASLVGSRTLDRLQRQVDGARAKLVLGRGQPPALLHRRRWGSAGIVSDARSPGDRADHQPPPVRTPPGVGAPGPRRPARRQGSPGRRRLRRPRPHRGRRPSIGGPPSADRAVVERAQRRHYGHPGRDPGRCGRPQLTSQRAASRSRGARCRDPPRLGQDLRRRGPHHVREERPGQPG